MVPKKLVLSLTVMSGALIGAGALAAPTQEWTYHKTDDGRHPNSTEQAIVWLMNTARQNPPAEGIWLATSTEPSIADGRDLFGVDTKLLQSEFGQYEPKPPAAFDVRLYQAALAHSQDLIARDAQDHEGQDERVEKMGFQFDDLRMNVFASANDALNAHAAWNIDWENDADDGMQEERGHRSAVMSLDGDYTNVGIAAVVENDPDTSVGPLVISGNYAQAKNIAEHFNRFLVGTVWQDLNQNARYDAGEGIGGVTVTPDQGDYFAITADGGGYAIPITEAGDYEVTFVGDSLIEEMTQMVTVAAESVLLDLEIALPTEEEVPDEGESPDQGESPNDGEIGLQVQTTAVNFRPQHVGSTSEEKTVKLRNNGETDLSGISIVITGSHDRDFSKEKTSTCKSRLATRESCEINLTFTPKEEGEREAILTVSLDDGTFSETVALTGTGYIDKPAVKLSTQTVDFKEQAVKVTSEEQTLTLTNNGDAELSKIKLKIEGTDNREFALTENSTCGDLLAVGAFCQIALTFTPKEEGEKQAILSVSSDAETSPDQIPLMGIGMIYQPAVKLAPSDELDFGTQMVRETGKEKKVTLTNNGEAELSKLKIKLDGTDKRDFAIAETSDCGDVLMVKEKCQIILTFTPKASGERQATLVITSDAESSPDEIPLLGIGQEPQPVVRLNPTSLDFGNLLIEVASEEQTIKLKNTGDANLTDLAFAIEGPQQDEFATPSSTCRGDRLAIDKECTVGIIFTPAEPGLREATLIITSNAATSPDQVTLSGIGVAEDQPLVNLTPSALDFKKQTVFETSEAKTVTLSNQGLVALTDINWTIEGEHPAQFALVEDSTTCEDSLASEEECTLALTFTPDAEGDREAQLVINSNASTSPDILMLIGTGEPPASSAYPDLGIGVIIGGTGEPSENEAHFYGGISLATMDENGELKGTDFQSALTITMTQPFVASGEISEIPLAHQGQRADVLVLVKYVAETDQTGNLLLDDTASSRNCNLELTANNGSGFFMKLREEPDCGDIAQAECAGGSENFEVWNGEPNQLAAYQSVILSDTISLTEETGQEIYNGELSDLTGQLCFYMGYRLDDGTIVFNGQELIRLRIKEE